MQKIKGLIENRHFKDFLVVLVIILVALASFGLGRLSVLNNNDKIIIEEPKIAPSSVILAVDDTLPQNITKSLPETKSSPKPTSGPFFASNRGSKYYHLGCSGGKTLKEENKVYFSSEEQAMLAGYTKSSSCK